MNNTLRKIRDVYQRCLQRLVRLFRLWVFGEVCRVKLADGSTTMLMRDGMVIIRKGRDADAVPLWMCRHELQEALANVLPSA